MLRGTVEYAIVVNGEIANVSTSSNRERVQEHARDTYGDKACVVLLDSLPDDVKRRYRFWNERP